MFLWDCFAHASTALAYRLAPLSAEGLAMTEHLLGSLAQNPGITFLTMHTPIGESIDA